MFTSHIYLQIVSGLVLGVILVLFSHNRRLKLQSSKIYDVFIFLSFFNILADIFSVYTITHMNELSPVVNRFAHAVFLSTLEGLIYCQFSYVLSLSHRKAYMRKWVKYVFALPLVIALVMAVFGEIYYFNDGVSAYSYGLAVDALYACLTLYMLASNIAIIIHRALVSRPVRLAIHASTLIWMVAAVIQFRHPGLLISNVAVMLMVLYTYFALENPREHIDAESDCFNRRAMVLTIDETLASKNKFDIVNISIDNMRELNHRRGYSATAGALREMADFAKQLFETDVFRYHNSAFMLMTTLEEDEIMQRCEQLHIRMQRPFCERLNIHVQGRIDILKSALMGESCHDILETLDFILAYNRENVSTGVRVINEAILAEKKRSVILQQMLKDALSEDGFNVVYQPIYDARTKRFSSAEALVRMKDMKTLGFVSPDEFITEAERCGLIAQLGEVVLEKVCAMAASERIWEKGVSYIEVNLSGVQASDPELPDAIWRIMHRYNIAPSFLNFEITETAAVNPGEQLGANMERLRKLGCGFSMDDFGTGYSNLSQIAEAAYDLIKLDKSPIWPCFEENGEKPGIILRSVVGMIISLKSDIVAEGVETQQQAEALAEMGIRHLQGYYFSRPIPEGEYIAFINEAHSPNGTET